MNNTIYYSSPKLYYSSFGKSKFFGVASPWVENFLPSNNILSQCSKYSKLKFSTKYWSMFTQKLLTIIKEVKKSVIKIFIYKWIL